jgi:hypothetical protein
VIREEGVIQRLVVGWLEWRGCGISAVLGDAEAERESQSPKVAFFVEMLWFAHKAQAMS